MSTTQGKLREKNNSWKTQGKQREIENYSGKFLVVLNILQNLIYHSRNVLKLIVLIGESINS